MRAPCYLRWEFPPKGRLRLRPLAFLSPPLLKKDPRKVFFGPEPLLEATWASPRFVDEPFERLAGLVF